MFSHLFSQRFSELRRALAWTALAVGGTMTLGTAWKAVLLTVAVSLGGCAALPHPVERPVSVSHSEADVADTGLARIAAASIGAGTERSGFRLLVDGAEAFDARIALIRRAEKTLDVQYYLIADDATGRQFLRELQAAAHRGVRVRILLDDLYATGQDALLAGLAAHDRIEVRLFNPLPVRGDSFARRIVFSLHEISRINHRMHNKLFIADGSFAVTGGRNIADEYFDRSGQANFIDMDLLSSGPVVAELAAVFDAYWNSPVVYPIASLTGEVGPEAFARRVETLASSTDAIASAERADSIDAELADGRIALEPADAEVISDAPEKSAGATGGPTVADAHDALLESARTEVLIASPYFIPRAEVRATLAGLRAREVEVSVLTNSLATTDEPLVHYGYANHRPALLASGVALHELMPVAEAGGGPAASVGGSGRGSSSLGRLHTKLTVVDEERTFVGSMNMDPRSARINTEAGIVVRSAALARSVARFLRERQERASFHVQQRGSRLSWVVRREDGNKVRTIEPQAAQPPAWPVRWLAAWLGDEVL